MLLARSNPPAAILPPLAIRSHVVAGLLFVCVTWVSATALSQIPQPPTPQPNASADASPNDSLPSDLSFIKRDDAHPPNPELLRQLQLLTSDDRASHPQAEAAIKKLGPAALPHLPLTTSHLPIDVVERLTELRSALEIENGKQRQAVTKISLTGAMDLKEAFKKFSEQSGVELTPPRSPAPLPRSPAPGRKSQWQLNDVAFWEALDQILDGSNLSLDSSANNRLLTSPRSPAAAARTPMTKYIDGYRIRPSTIVKRNSFLTPAQSDLRIDIEFAWEPKNVPALISLQTETLKVACDNGEILPSKSTEPLIYFPVGDLNTELSFFFLLPTPQAQKIANWNGEFQVVTTGELTGVEFDQLDLANQSTRELKSGILNVVLESIRKNSDLIEIRVGVRMDNDQVREGWEQIWLDSQQAYLLDPHGNRIDHVGWSTTRFRPNDTGVSFLFELEKGLEGCKFVYLAPGAIHSSRHHFEITDIPLP